MKSTTTSKRRAKDMLTSGLQPELTDVRDLSVILGRLPNPIWIGGSRKWRIAELMEWIEAGCPERKNWEARRR